jgi:tetratricopeptide (TPR) repeat protein
LIHYDAVEDYFKTYTSLFREEKWNDILIKGQYALIICDKNDQKKEKAKICAQLTSIAYYLGNYDLALQYANECHKLSEEFSDPELFLKALYLEFAVYRALAGKNQDANLQQIYFTKAVEVAEKSLAIFESKHLNSELLKGKIYFNLGAAHAENPKGNLKLANKNYYLALQSYKKINSIDNIIRTNIRLGKVYLLQKNYKNVQIVIDKAKSLMTSIASERISMQLDYLKSQFKLAKKDIFEAKKIAKKGLRKAKKLNASEDCKRFVELLSNIKKSKNK